MQKTVNRIKMMNTNTTKIHVDHNTAASNVKTAAKPIYLDNFDQNVTTARCFMKSWNPSTKIWTHCFWSERWKERMVSLSLTSLQHVVLSWLASEETILFWLATKKNKIPKYLKGTIKCKLQAKGLFIVKRGLVWWEGLYKNISQTIQRLCRVRYCLKE